VKPSRSAKEGIRPDPKVIAQSLMQLTSGWTPGPGVAPESLTAARTALAMSLFAGRSLDEIHAARPPLSWQPGADPALSADLLQIASDATAATPAPATGIIRSAYAATVTNPSGVPAWARDAQVEQSFGPFIDHSGVSLWVDSISGTSSTQFAFGDSSTPFGMFPVFFSLRSPLDPVSPVSDTNLTLGSGSVWFLAEWLETSLPAGSFTGFSIASGTLVSSQAMTIENGVYVLPPAATLTVTMQLAAAPHAGTTSGPGAVFTPPSEVTLVFKPSGAVFQSIAPAGAKAYGSSVTLNWNASGSTIKAVKELPEILVPCTASPASFTFSNAAPGIFEPSGSASVTDAGWALPLVATAITNLPDAAGPGAALLRFGSGGTLKTTVQPGAGMKDWVMEIRTGGLYILTTGPAEIAKTKFQLWPEAAPSKLNATADFFLDKKTEYGYLAWPAHELVVATGFVEAHLDRPQTAAGGRFPFLSHASLVLYQDQAGTDLILLGIREEKNPEIITVALENALMGLYAPAVFLLAGTLKDTQVLPSVSDGRQLLRCCAGFCCGLRWLLPTLPDPYASNFDSSPTEKGSFLELSGTVLAITSWTGHHAMPELKFTLLQAGSDSDATLSGASFALPQSAVSMTKGGLELPMVLLDLSTRVDLFGVALAPDISGTLDQGLREIADKEDVAVSSVVNDTANPAPYLAFSGMSLTLNGAIVATFALPQFSWEPMESTATPDRPVACDPPSDGDPLVVAVPDTQQLVPFAPAPVLLNNIENVAAGKPFGAWFSLPFGLNAAIFEMNQPVKKAGGKSLFLMDGGRFATNIPRFPNSVILPPASAIPPTNPPQPLAGALTLSLMPANPGPGAGFPGYTETAGNYGMLVLSPDARMIFNGEFSPSAPSPLVPLERIDFSGYGASIFSEWVNDGTPPCVRKVQFAASLGRTALDVIQVESIIYPYCIEVVRTIIMQRQNAGWVKRSDSGWQAVSEGIFVFPFKNAGANPYMNRVHPGALCGAYNVRNIRDQALTLSVTAPNSTVDPGSGKKYEFREVLFDADLVLDGSLTIRSGGVTGTSEDTAGLTVVPSKNMVGFLQLSPDFDPPYPETLALLFRKTGPLTPEISCTVEVGDFNQTPGLVLRCSAFEVDMVTEPTNQATLAPAVGVALRGAPRIPRGGGWSMGQRSYKNPAPSALPNNYPVPLVRPAFNNDFWYIADLADILQLTTPATYYSLLHSTGTHKILFESPQIPTSAGVSPTPSAPGLQFPKPGSPKAGGAPANPGSPNLGDLASILNSTGLFPDIASAVSMMTTSVEQINTIDNGFNYSKTYSFQSDPPETIVNLAGLLSVMMAYTPPQGSQQLPPQSPFTTPTMLIYTVDSSASPSWSLSIGLFFLEVMVDGFSGSGNTDPVLTISGGFYADEHTAPGITDLNVQFGGALSVVKSVFSALQMLAQFLPGGASADLDVALSDGLLTVMDTFSINDLPLGLGNLTDVSVDIGLNVQLQPMSANFSVGIGSPDNPFNWIATPLAGNGMISLGVQDNHPNMVIQAGIGLGLAIDLGIASGSASVTVAFQLNMSTKSITLMAILTGQAEVDVLDGLASASLTLSAALGLSVSSTPFPPYPELNPSSLELTIPSVDVTLLASVSVGIHITVCWLLSVSWDGSWQFSESISTPSLTVEA